MSTSELSNNYFEPEIFENLHEWRVGVIGVFQVVKVENGQTSVHDDQRQFEVRTYLRRHKRAERLDVLCVVRWNWE